MMPEHWTLFDHSPQGWALLLFAAMVVGFSKTGVAGVGILNPVLFAMIFPVAESVGFLLPMLIMADLFAVGAYRKDAQWRYLLYSLPWVIVGIGAGYFCMRRFQSLELEYDSVMRISIGVIVLVMLALSLWLKWRQTRHGELHPPVWMAPLFGLLTGFTTMLANAAGPIYAMYLLIFALPKRQFMGTRAVAFFLINWIKVPLQWDLGNITGESLVLNACLFPAIAIGAWLGIVTLKHIPEKLFRVLIQVLVLLACLRLIYSGIAP